jgi:hypothetical protein
MSVKFEGRLTTRTTPQSAIDNWGRNVLSDRAQRLNPEGVKAIPVVTSSTPPPPPAPPGGTCPCRKRP